LTFSSSIAGNLRNISRYTASLRIVETRNKVCNCHPNSTGSRVDRKHHRRLKKKTEKPVIATEKEIFCWVFGACGGELIIEIAEIVPAPGHPCEDIKQPDVPASEENIKGIGTMVTRKAVIKRVLLLPIESASFPTRAGRELFQAPWRR
jgi:hypothetical protein